MDNWQIDVTPASQQRVSLSPEHKAASILIEADGGPLDKLALALRSASLAQLKSSLKKRIEARHDEGALHLGAELSRRGVAPCFRDIPVSSDTLVLQGADTEWILTLLDLQWVALTYPEHKPEWGRLKSLFIPKQFVKTVKYLDNSGDREAGQIVKALALTEEQQRELLWVQCLHVKRWLKLLRNRLTIAQAKIKAAIRATDRRTLADQDATIERRTKLWLCAELANWKPQRTAELFKMVTGENMQRATVGTQLGKLPKVRQADENATDTVVGWGM